ncbi:MAG: filamentous hemagglutinin N-terminal domain-containing protein [Pleurocapsa sp. MO_226.B13]|nr:filamentous hemagglutinin N-terminal domain-containing protein [Pleurocapsa sp. MO_226.B13]
MLKALHLLLKIILYACGFLLTISKVSSAQVTSDNTTNTQVNQNGNVAEIRGGERRGSNLFHSFRDFSVPTGNEAFFNNNADTISNILGRVTGGNSSNIDGLIRANGSANLFLINPAGIIFGENARLDIGGSFYGSTASSILFENGEFSAVGNIQQPMLTINAPIGLSFRDNPQPITNRSTANSVGLQVAPGETIGLIGGNISFVGGLITAPGGNIQLGGLSSAGEIRIDAENNFTFTDGIAKANVTLSDLSTVNVRGSNGGRIEINANNLELAGASQLLAGIELGEGSPQAQADDISINTNAFIARGESGVRNENLGTGNGGNINITTGTLDFRDGSAIVASTFGTDNAGNVTINASGDVSFDRDFGGVFS